MSLSKTHVPAARVQPRNFIGKGNCMGREHSGSMVECLTRDRGAAGSSLTGITALWSLSKTHLTQLSTGLTQEDPSLFN